MPRKIAIIKEFEAGYYENYEKVVASITDWVEVSEADYKILKKAEADWRRTEQFSVIEQPIDQAAFVRETVAQWLEFVRKEEQKRQEAERKKQEAAEKRKAERLQKQLARDAKKRKDLYEQLKQEFEEEKKE